MTLDLNTVFPDRLAFMSNTSLQQQQKIMEIQKREICVNLNAVFPDRLALMSSAPLAQARLTPYKPKIPFKCKILSEEYVCL